MDINNAVNLITEKLNTWGKDFIAMLPNLALAALIITVAFFIAKLAKNLAFKFISKISHKSVLNNLFSTFIYILFIGLGLFGALTVIGATPIVTSILAGAGIVGLALGFAFQDMAANFISGIFITFRRPFNVGDLVKMQDFTGRIKIVNLRDTIITTLQGHDVIIPNKDVFQNPIENLTSSGKRRMDLSVGVSYGDDLQKVKDIVLKALQDVPHKSEEDEITLYYKEFGDSSINFDVRIWIDSTEQASFLSIQSEAIMLIKAAFDTNNITIPFPIRTLDFGIKGGEKLSEMDVNIKNRPNNN